MGELHYSKSFECRTIQSMEGGSTMSVQYGMPVRCLSRGSALIVRRRFPAAAVASRTAGDHPNPDNLCQNTRNIL
jgi:hypothetical protein